MSKQPLQIDINKIRDLTQLIHLVEEVQANQQPRVLTRNGEELVEVTPVRSATKRHNSGVLTQDDPLSKLVGTAKSDKPTDASEKYKYLAEVTTR